MKASKLNFLGKVRENESLLLVWKRDSYECERGIVMILYSLTVMQDVTKLSHLHITTLPSRVFIFKKKTVKEYLDIMNF